jgi:alkanesulfonate monooxygenase SsuD/methylene tetrahydromethanopterin reductase-like flavin-dependent oxidoreductase (luciferase family)
MKVGVLQFFGWADRNVALASVYDRALERFAIMDRTGYDAVWLAEHHFSGFSVCPSVHMMATMAAAQTERLRIGTAVSLAPFYHPLRLAEGVALLDVLSGGRVNWGAGRGFSRVEFDAFGIPVEESAARFRETVDIVLAAWSNERLTHHGEHSTPGNAFRGSRRFAKPSKLFRSRAGARSGSASSFSAHRRRLPSAIVKAFAWPATGIRAKRSRGLSPMFVMSRANGQTSSLSHRYSMASSSVVKGT